MPSWTRYAAKFLTAAVGAAAIAISQGLVVGTAAKWVAVVIAAGGAAGVWLVPNAKAPSKPA